MIKATSPLSAKVTIGGPGAVDEAALQRAEQVIEDLADTYLDTVRSDLENIQKAFSSLKAGTGDKKKHLADIFQIAFDIKGQGGSFDFNLMTIIGNQLCRFLDGLGGEANDSALEVIQLHIDALQVVIAQGLKGDGGTVGEQLLSGLEGVIAKRAGG